MSEILSGDRWVIEVSGQGVGTAVREAEGLVFHAADPKAAQLDKHPFQNLHEARRAVEAILHNGHN